MIRDIRDKIAIEISNQKGMELIQVQELIELFLKFAYKEDYIVIKNSSNRKR